MIINKDVEVKSIGFDEGAKMTIKNKNLGKVYNLLTTSSYKDSYGSIIREFCANAVDSNVSAGKSLHPIFVKFNNNTITIKDDGLGMSEEFIYDVYMSLGDSTKDEEEFSIGGFGIGSKAIFSYRKDYTLVSRWEGEKKTYIISETEDNLPDAILISTEDTEECNGVEIIFDLLNNNDYSKFKYAVEQQLKYFKNIIIEGFDVSNDYKIIQGENFIYRPDRVNYTNKLELCWGQANYPIDFNFLGIKPININCSLYFPQNAKLQPEAARENLRNTENNKKLILEKIEEFKKEIKELYKKQEIVDDFFEWKNSSDGVMELESHRLNVYDVINSPRIWAPTLNTNLNKDFKSYLYKFENVLMSYRPNKKSYNSGWWHTNTNNKIYYALSNISNQRLAKTGWNGLWTKREISPEMYISQYDLDKVYDKNFYSIDAVTKEATWTIDYHSEFQYLADEIFKCVQKHSIDVHTVPVPKNISNKNSYGKEEIRAKIGHSWGKYPLSCFDKYRYVVYTIDEGEYNLWKNLSLSKRDRKGSRQDNIFIIFLTTSPHVKKLPDSFISPEEFLNSEILKNSFIRYKKSQFSVIHSIDTYVYENLHKMYRNRVNELKKKIVWRNSGWGETNFPRWVEERLEKMYDVSHWEKQYKRRDKELAKYHYRDNYGNNKEYLKYKILYQYKSKQFKLLKERCK